MSPPQSHDNTNHATDDIDASKETKYKNATQKCAESLSLNAYLYAKPSVTERLMSGTRSGRSVERREGELRDFLKVLEETIVHGKSAAAAAGESWGKEEGVAK